MREALPATPVRIEHIYISSGHNYFGHHGGPAGKHAIVKVARAELVANKGIVGDRFFNFRTDYKGQVTFFALEVYQSLCLTLGVSDKTPAAFRRNFVVSGVNLNALIGKRFSVQGIIFEGVEECRPCPWMDDAFAPGAELLLKGGGGLRARVLSDGILRVDLA